MPEEGGGRVGFGVAVGLCGGDRSLRGRRGGRQEEREGAGEDGGRREAHEGAMKVRRTTDYRIVGRWGRGVKGPPGARANQIMR